MYSACACPSVDTVNMINQYLFNIRSMRKRIKEINENSAYCWFFGCSSKEPET
ncbi:transposase [Enterococcus sp. AZ177]|uniref:transposase n=1 Tax=unclassified Enterococcus TaxID=2608891 RepID=UPI003D2FEA70